MLFHEESPRSQTPSHRVCYIDQQVFEPFHSNLWANNSMAIPLDTILFQATCRGSLQMKNNNHCLQDQRDTSYDSHRPIEA